MTDLIEVKTIDLAGEALGWAVGKAEGLDVYLEQPGYNSVPLRVFVRHQGEATMHTKSYNLWEDWALAGALLDKHCIIVIYAFEEYEALIGMSGSGYHPRSTIAVCRAIVAAKLGDTVQVPKELLIDIKKEATWDTSTRS
ncbi:phage protein NinX family protein [Pseudomonas sp. NBRC 111119]|uniref:phage protein NinX family protein n=1 Tax=Pseudomonas sp. NBRC 111119 TaxID=1661034 RepID=UPI0007614C9D|nr:phage protein NinX family protein [Pseudomonas sp. NBRC 111119]